MQHVHNGEVKPAAVCDGAAVHCNCTTRTLMQSYRQPVHEGAGSALNSALLQASCGTMSAVCMALGWHLALHGPYKRLLSTLVCLTSPTCAVRSLKASNSLCSCTFCLFRAAHWSAMSCRKQNSRGGRTVSAFLQSSQRIFPLSHCSQHIFFCQAVAHSNNRSIAQGHASDCINADPFTTTQVPTNPGT